tara:strand:+ start:367 stop:570 length:204 start_codon:yes stop_codon:yes gene_type:complete
MDENNSIIFLAFFSLFIFVASICSCVDRVINRRTSFSRIENISEINEDGNADTISIPPKYEEIYETN